MSDRRGWVERLSGGRTASTTEPSASRPEPGPDRPVRSNGPERPPLPGPGPRARPPVPDAEGPTLRVVLVSRDNMLAGALRSLIETPGGVRVLDWYSEELDGAIRHADVVIVDMPPNLHERTFAVIDGRFLGRTVVLLQEGEHAEAVPAGPTRAVLFRPLQIGELWTAITGATTPVPAEPPPQGVEAGSPPAQELEEPEAGAEEAADDRAAPGQAEGAAAAAAVEVAGQGLSVAESGRLIGLSGRELEPVVGPGQVAPGMDEATFERLRRWGRQGPGKTGQPAGKRRTTVGRAEARRAKEARAEAQRAEARRAKEAEAEARRADRAAAGRAKAASAEARREQTRQERAARQGPAAASAEVGRVRAARAESRTAARGASRQAKAAQAEARQVARAESRQARTDARKVAQERSREAKAAKAEARTAEQEKARQAKAAQAEARAAVKEEDRQAKAAQAEAQAAAREEARRVKAAHAEAQAAARQETRKAQAALAATQGAPRQPRKRHGPQSRRRTAGQGGPGRSPAAAREEARQAEAAAQEEARQAKAAQAEARAAAQEEARQAKAAQAEARRVARVEAGQVKAAEAAVRRAARAEARQVKAAETKARRAERAEARGIARAEARQARAARAETRRTARTEARQVRAASIEARREQSRQARAARAAARTAAREEAARIAAVQAAARQAARAEEDQKRAAEAEARQVQAQQARAEQAEAREAARAEAGQARAAQAEVRREARAEPSEAEHAEMRKTARAEAAQQRRVQAEARRAQSREVKAARAQAREADRAEAGRKRAEQAEVRRVARAEAGRQREARVAARGAARAEARQARAAGVAPRVGAGGVGLLALVVLVVAVVGLVAAGWRGGEGPDSRAGEVAVVRAAGGSEGGLVVQDPRVGPIEPLYALGVGVVLRGAEAGTSLEGAIRDARVPSRYLLAGVVGLTVLLFLLLMRVGPGTGAAAGPGPAPPQRQGRDRLWRLGGAALAGLLVALDPMLVRSGRAATGTILAVVLALVTLALAWGVPARPTLRWLPLVAAGGGLALLVSPLALPVLAVPVVAELLGGRYQEAWRDMAALGLAVGLWLVLPVWVAGQELGAGQAAWLLGRPPGRGSVVASLADDRLTWLLVAAGLAAAILAWRHRSGARPDADPDPPGDHPGPARALAWTLTTAAGAVGAVALGYPASQALPFAVPAAAVSLALAGGWAAAAVRWDRGTAGVPPRWIGAGVAVALAGLLVAQGVDWGARYGGQADDGLGRLVATVGDQVPDCSAVNASGPDDRARLLAAGVTVTDFADGPAAHAAGVRYFVLTGGSAGGGPMTPSLAAWVRQHGTRMAAHPSRSLSGVELWRVDAAPLDPVADSLPVPDGLFSNVNGSACGGYRVVDNQAGTFHTAYRAAGGKMVLGRPLGSVWTSDGPALQAFDTMVLGSVPTASGPPAVRPIELPPLLAQLDIEAVADANIPLPSVRPPVTNRQVRTLLSDELIARAYLSTDPASASAEDFRRARDRFGRPLGVPQMMPDGAMRQPFERAVLELPANGGPARPAALGRLAVRLGLVPKQAMRLEPVPGLPAPPVQTRLDPAPLLRLIGVGLVLLALATGSGAVVARRSRTAGAR